MKRNTLRDVKRNLAAAFPDVAFAYGTAGRSRQSGHLIEWTGGPPPDLVRHASQCCLQWHMPYHFRRIPTQTEMDAADAQYEAERPAREAAAAQSRIDRKAAGIAKAAETRRANKALASALADAFPTIEFTIAPHRVEWTDGPEESDVRTAIGLCDRDRYLYRSESTEAQRRKAAQQAVDKAERRTTRRLAQSKVRTIRRARGINRIKRLHDEMSRQPWLPLWLPDKSKIYEITLDTPKPKTYIR